MITLTMQGIGKALTKLNAATLYEEPIQQFLQESSEVLYFNIAALTPVKSGRLLTSIKPTIYRTLVKVHTPLVYGGYIERGWRSDPRAHSGRVNRRAGPALMFRQGRANAMPSIHALFEALKQQIRQRWAA